MGEARMLDAQYDELLEKLKKLDPDLHSKAIDKLNEGSLEHGKKI